MSNIPEARARLDAFIENVRLTPAERSMLREILPLLDREQPVGQAPRVRIGKSPEQISTARQLWRSTRWTGEQIATFVGWRNHGRVYEVCQGLPRDACLTT